MHPIFQKTEKKIYTAVPQFFLFFEIEILWYKFDQKLTGFLGLKKIGVPRGQTLDNEQR